MPQTINRKVKIDKDTSVSYKHERTKVGYWIMPNSLTPNRFFVKTLERADGIMRDLFVVRKKIG